VETREHSEDIDVNGWIILKCIVRKQSLGCVLDSRDSGPTTVCCENGNEPSFSINGVGVLD
jgi:hypothetical protein